MKSLHELIWTPTPKEIALQRLWIGAELKKLGFSRVSSLAIRAKEARERTYSPYSNYGVGAALLCISGEIYEGLNIETHTYSETTHAEQMAVFSAVGGGEIKRSGRKFVKAIAVSHSGNSAPCGKCQQTLYEFCDNAIVIVADPQGIIRGITSLAILAPWSFKPSDLGTK